MPEPALFSALIVSTPSRNGRRVRWIRATAWAIALHGTAITLFLVVPLLVVETMPPQASVPVILRPPRPPRVSGNGPRAPLIKQGSGGPAASSVTRAEQESRAPRRDIQPDRVAIDPPQIEHDEASPLPADGEGTAGPGGTGHPEGTGESEVGLPDGCIGCDATGTRGVGGEGDDAVLDLEDPRITKPILIEATRAMPRYPEVARKARITGEVVLLIVIQADGTIGEIDVLRTTDPRLGFDLAAIEAVKHWRYRPALLQGRPVAVRAIVQVEFVLAR